MKRRLAQCNILLLSVLMLSACGGMGRSTKTLQDRLTQQLCSQHAQHQASVQPIADGAQIAFDEASLFTPGRPDLSASGRYIIESFTEGLLAPGLMQISATDTSQETEDLRTQRTQTVLRYVQASSLSPLSIAAVEPSALPQQPVTAGFTIAVQVRCPPGRQGTTWGYPPQRATCN